MRKRARQTKGFTLVELLIAAALAAFAMTALLSSFVFLARNFTRLANYQTLENEGRKALAYLQADLELAERVKPGSTPTAAGLTLVLPAGEVTYTYDSATQRLRRQAGFGAGTDLGLLTGPSCRCTDFSFDYFTGSNGAPEDQLSPGTFVPYSIKQVRVRFSLQNPAAEANQTRMTYAAVSARVNLRNKRPPDGS